MFRRCTFSYSPSQPWSFTSIVCFFPWGQKKGIRSFESAPHRKQVLHDLHDLILQLNYDLEYSSDFSTSAYRHDPPSLITHYPRCYYLLFPRFLSIIPSPASRHISRIRYGNLSPKWKESWSSLQIAQPLYMILLANVCDFVSCFVVCFVPCAFGPMQILMR
jgi:hypothetical protein